MGVESEIREALINLIFNAVDAMPTGGVLTLRTKVAADHVHVEVSDTGCGHERGNAPSLPGTVLYHQRRTRYGPRIGDGLWRGATGITRKLNWTAKFAAAQPCG